MGRTIKPFMPEVPTLDRTLAENAMLKQKMASGRFFTAAELIEHDKLVARDARVAAHDKNIADLKKYMDEEYIRQKDKFEVETNEFWEQCKDEFRSGTEDENWFAWCRVMWSIPIAVLVEKFHWKPITSDCCMDNRQALVKFCNSCIDMANTLREDQTKDIRTLCKEIDQKYGASFVIGDEDE